MATKNIVITISRGAIAKNLLDNDFYKILRERFSIVILSPAYNEPRFIESYAHQNVTFAPLPDVPFGMIDRFLFFFHKHLIYNSTVNQKMRWGIIGDPRSKRPTVVGYKIKRAIFSFLSKIIILRDFVRLLDLWFTQKADVERYAQILKAHNPVCVISTHITDDAEVALLKAARKLGILTIGFPKSWDNLSKHGFRIKLDYLVVWNEFMKEQAIEFHNYRPSQVIPIGVPQYDFNFKPDMLMSREEYCGLYDLDPDRKIILFGSEGKLFPSDRLIATILAHLVTSDSLIEPSSLIIRPHYGYKGDEKKFISVTGLPEVAVDLLNNPSEGFRDEWDYSDAFTKRFVNALYHADVVINTASTLTLDAVCFDKPVINIAFNDVVPVPYSESIERWYETYYYKRILSYKATTLVRSSAELTKALNEYYKDPNHKALERKRLRDDFTYRYDGKAGERFAHTVIDLIGTHANP